MATSEPGYAVLAVKAQADVTMAANPAHVASVATRTGSSRIHEDPTAISAPREISHARVPSEK